MTCWWSESFCVNKLTLMNILLITTIVVFNLFYLSTKSLLLGMKCVSKHQDSQIFGLQLNKYMGNFQPLEVVGRGSETQLQVADNLNKLRISRVKSFE